MHRRRQVDHGRTLGCGLEPTRSQGRHSRPRYLRTEHPQGARRRRDAGHEHALWLDACRVRVMMMMAMMPASSFDRYRARTVIDRWMVVGVGLGLVRGSTKPHGIKVMSIAFLLASRESAVVWRGPRKTSTTTSMLEITDTRERFCGIDWSSSWGLILIRHDQALPQGRLLGQARLPRDRHASWHERRASLDRGGTQVSESRWSRDRHDASTCGSRYGQKGGA